jgi:hypothetical protein
MEKLYCIMLRNKQKIEINEERFKAICQICFNNKEKYVLIDDCLINLVDMVCITPVEKTMTDTEKEQFIINKYLKK